MVMRYDSCGRRREHAIHIGRGPSAEMVKSRSHWVAHHKERLSRTISIVRCRNLGGGIRHPKWLPSPTAVQRESDSPPYPEDYLHISEEETGPSCPGRRTPERILDHTCHAQRLAIALHHFVNKFGELNLRIPMVPPDLRNATITLSEFYQTLSFECFDARQELTQWGSAELTHAGNRIENGNAIQGDHHPRRRGAVWVSTIRTMIGHREMVAKGGRVPTRSRVKLWSECLRRDSCNDERIR
jgi:hypothetical protein